MEQKKQGFGSKIGFILAAAGSAVGLGNIWRFPYLVGRHGGGAFVLVYLLSVLLLGTVVMIAEMFIGKRAQRDIVNSYGKANKWLKWVGLLGVMVPFIISTYYAVIGGWASGYAVEYVINSNAIAQGGAGAAFSSFISDPVRSILFFALFLVAAILIVCGGVQKGIEKAGKILMPALFVLLIAVIIAAMCLPGKGEGQTVVDGLTFYLGKFDFEALGWNGVIAAMGQAFFSLSLGMGVMIAYGSYTGKDINIGKSALTVCGLDTLVALLAGFAIFPAMFATGNSALVSEAGAGLMFIALPEVFAAMGTAGNFVGFMFFVLVIFAAITSLISLIEVVSQYTLEKYHWSRAKATCVFGGIIGLIGLFVCLSQGRTKYNLFGFDLLTYFDEVTNVVIMPILAFFACITVGYIIKPKNVMKELEEMGSSFKGQKFWLAMTMSVTPALVLIVLIMGIIDKFPYFADPKKGGLNYGYVLGGAAVLIVLSILWNVMLDSKKVQEFKAKRAAKLAVAGECDCECNCDCNCECDVVEETSTEANETIVEETATEEVSENAETEAKEEVNE